MTHSDAERGSDGELAVRLEEAEAHLKATSEVLKVISEYPQTASPVFDAIAKRAADLCGAAFCNIRLFDGEHTTMAANYNFPPEIGEKLLSAPPEAPDPNVPSGRAILTGAVVHEPDILAEGSLYPKDRALAGGWRALLAVPMLRKDEPVGSITVAQPFPVEFSEKQIQLLNTFASQAVIALDNAELVSQLEKRTSELADLNRTLETRVAEQVDELERVGRLRRFLPRQLAEVVINTGDESLLDSHRREVSVVFCDLRGFTAFSEVAEPEEVTSVLGEYHGVAGPLIEQHGGTLERFLGDGLMVLFNDPLPCDDPAQRAVRLAVELRDAMDDLSEQWSSQDYELGFGVGIAHGFATIGRIGFEGRSDYTAIGSVVNQAARLCDEAGAGEIIITQRIANIAKQLIEAEPLGPLELKGLRQPVRALRLVGIAT